LELYSQLLSTQFSSALWAAEYVSWLLDWLRETNGLLRTKTNNDNREITKQFRRLKIDMKYRVHRFEIDMTKDQNRLEDFLNNLDGEVVSIIPSINS
jgi:hypothetical protein